MGGSLAVGSGAARTSGWMATSWARNDPAFNRRFSEHMKVRLFDQPLAEAGHENVGP